MSRHAMEHRMTRRHARACIRDLKRGFCNMKDCGKCGVNGQICRTLFFPSTCPIITDLVAQYKINRKERFCL